jgi:glycine cleavage system regulatory protein
MAAIRYLFNRASTYDLHPTYKQAEMDKIKHILHNNKYNSSVLDILKRQKQHPKQAQDLSKQKWAKFTYTGKVTRTVTKLFQQAGIKIAYTTKNNLENIQHHRYQQ